MDGRHGTSQRSSIANRVRQPHQLNANQQHVHVNEIKYCEDKRPGKKEKDERKTTLAKSGRLH
eukprot:450535-Pelagomonas_calceolata.AAC.1